MICPRWSGNVTNAKAAFKLFSNAEFSSLTRLKKFLVLFPISYLEDILIPETNKGLEVDLSLQEFLVWLGCWMFMATHLGVSSRQDWWSLSPVSSHKEAPFRLNKYMSHTRFEAILQNLKYTNKTVPYRDGFLQIR